MLEIHQHHHRNILVGMDIHNAYKYCETKGWQYRIESNDGNGLMITSDLRADRINFTVVNNIVTKVRWG